jgi:hypothetical protein
VNTNLGKSLIIAAWSISTLVAVCSVAEFCRSKPLWQDELYGISSGVQEPSVFSLILHGAPNQGSPAPLYYLVLKCWEVLGKTSVGGLKAEFFWRIPSIAATMIGAGILLVVLLGRLPGIIPVLIAIGFCWSWESFYFSAETRPYALWNALSVLTLAGTLQKFRQPWWILVLIALSFTANASIFQIAALLCCAAVTFHLFPEIEQKRRILGMLAASLGVSVYYALLSSSNWMFKGPEWGTWGNFFEMTLSYKWPIIGGCLCLYLSRHFRDAGKFFCVLACLSWFAMGPGVYLLTRSHGVFFSWRQYIYWTGATSMILGILLTYGWTSLKERRWLLFGLLSLLAMMSLRRLEVHRTVFQVLRGKELSPSIMKLRPIVNRWPKSLHRKYC